VRALGGRRCLAIRLRLDAVADDLERRGGTIAGEQCFADVLGDTDNQRRLALQCRTAPLEDGWEQPASVGPIFGRIAAMEGDDQREPEGAGDRQREGAAAAEMSMDQSRLQ